jgi:hypothetical protein
LAKRGQGKKPQITNDEERLLLNFSGESRITLSSWIFTCSFSFPFLAKEEMKISAASSTFSHENRKRPPPKNRYSAGWVYFLSAGGWNRVQMDCIFDLFQLSPPQVHKEYYPQAKAFRADFLRPIRWLNKLPTQENWPSKFILFCVS